MPFSTRFRVVALTTKPLGPVAKQLRSAMPWKRGVAQESPFFEPCAATDAARVFRTGFRVLMTEIFGMR